jgi:hypothetical protein
MKHAMTIRGAFVGGATLTICLSLALSATALAQTTAGPSQNTQVVLSAKDKQTVAAFDKRVKEYVKMRERVERKMPKLSKDATPEQIEAHKTTFQERVRAARAGAKPAQIFKTDIASYIRATIKDEFKGRDRAELRETVFEAETQGVPVRVNYPYPPSKELLEMPPTLLLRLPQLPKQLRFRFVGRSMLLMDRENGLIIDYMTDALP